MDDKNNIERFRLQKVKCKVEGVCHRSYEDMPELCCPYIEGIGRVVRGNCDRESCDKIKERRK